MGSGTTFPKLIMNYDVNGYDAPQIAKDCVASALLLKIRRPILIAAGIGIGSLGTLEIVAVRDAHAKAAAGSAVSQRFGPACHSSKECGRRRECVPHYDITHAVVRYTCEYPCDDAEAAGRRPSKCPKTRVCVIFSDGPESSLGGICVRKSHAPPTPPPPDH